MHVRFSTVLGMPIVEEGSEEGIALLSGILLHPDAGRIEGFLAYIPGFLHTQEVVLLTQDIRHWGKRIRVRDQEVLSPLGELVRLQSMVEEGRPILGQPIVTENGMKLGKCRDVQFDTTTFYLEWIFPKKFWKWGVSIPASSIVEVKTDAIIVRDAVTIPEPATSVATMLETLDPLSSSAQRVMERVKQ